MIRDRLKCVPLWTVAAALLLAMLLVIGPWIAEARAVGALLLVAVVPGYGLTVLLFGCDDSLDALEVMLLSVAIGVSLLVVGTLALHYWPGALTQAMLLALYGAVSFVALLLIFLQCPRTKCRSLDWRRSTVLPFLLIITVAVGLRLVNLSYSEFQGDEGRAVLRAAEVLQGNDEVLFLHKKGPVEILIPAAVYGATGRMTEWTARFPFALANIAAVLGVYVLGRRIWGRWVGAMASALAASDGFFTGFSRIVQYQSIVLLMTVTCVWAAYRVFQGTKRRSAYLFVIGLCAGVALLAHYEGVFLLPPVLFLLWMSTRKSSRRWRELAGSLVLPAVIGGVATLSFYVPFVLHPHFRETASYLGVKRVGGGLLYNNLADFCERAMFYNAPLYVVFMLAGLLVVGVGVLVWRGRGRYATSMALLLGLLTLSIGLFPSLWQIGTVSLAALAFLAAVIALYVRCDSVKARVLIVWFAPVAVLYFFMMLKVHTHYYVAFVPWMLAIAGGIDWLRRPLDLPRTAKAAIGVIGAVLWLGAAGHTALAFVRHTPEYRHSYPASRPRLYWSPYGAQMPRGGYFGFPYRTAWKAVGEMYAEGLLVGPYESNQEDLITNWYTRGELRCPTSDLFIVARNVENPHAIIPGVIDGTYRPKYEIVRDGMSQIWIFERGYADELITVRYDDSLVFDQELSRPEFRMGVALDEVFEPENQARLTFGDEFELAGWSLESGLVAPGEMGMLTLYWRALQETPADYHVFCHVGDDPTVAHSDSVPRCGQSPTYRWTVGQEVVDRHLLAFAPDADGVYSVRVGIYDYGTKRRLHATDEHGSDLGGSILLGKIRVGMPQVAADEVGESMGRFGDVIALDDVSISEGQRGAVDKVELDIIWKCLGEMATDYTVFVHLIGPDGEILGQADIQPRGGTLPTSYWVAGEVIKDRVAVTLGDSSPLGEYRILVGLYEPETWARLPVVDALGDSVPDGALPVGALVVGE